MELGLLFELGYEVFELGEMAQIDTQRTLPTKKNKIKKNAKIEIIGSPKI
jgi:hypothetical protein